MAGWTDPESHVVPVARLIASLAAGVILAAVGGMVLGEYTFQGKGIQWLSISGGVGLGAVIAWVLNRVWAHHPPLWMGAVAGLLAMAGEALAVQRDMDGYAWPPEAWVAVLLAGAAGAYGIYSANRVAAQERAKKG
jgi:ABC-type Fe3+-siderophore transport system permease subunit